MVIYLYINMTVQYTNNQVTCDWSELSKPRAFVVKTITPRLRGGVLRLNFINLEAASTYRWMIKNEVQDADVSGIDFADFTLGVGGTSQIIVPALLRTVYQRTLNLSENNKYSFILQKEGGGTEYRFDFQIFDDGIHNENGELIRRFSSFEFTRSSNDIDPVTNKIVDEKSLNENDQTLAVGSKIPTNGMVKGYVNNQVATGNNLDLKIAQNLNDLASKPTARTNLDVFSRSEVDTKDALKENIANKGQNNGYASLDVGGKIPSSQLPPVAITDTFVVNSQANMLGLAAQVGDVAVRADLNKTFILRAEPATTLGNWQEMLTPTDTVLSVNGQTGVVSLSTLTVPENTNLYFTDTRVRTTPLTGFVPNNAAIVPTDIVLQGFNKAQGQINDNIISINNRLIKTGDTITGNISNTATGFLSIPSGTTAQRPGTPLDGMRRYNTTTLRDEFYANGSWQNHARLTGDTFTGAVGGVNPTNSNHYTTRDFVDPANIVYNQVLSVKNRFLDEGLIFDGWKAYRLERIYKEILIETKQSQLPNFLLTPELSADLSTPSSTKLINLGTDNALATIVNSTVGNFISNGLFNFLASSTRYINTNYAQEDDLTKWSYMIDLQRPLISSGQDQTIVGSMSGTSGYTIFSNTALTIYNQERLLNAWVSQPINMPANSDTLISGVRDSNGVRLITGTVIGNYAVPTGAFVNRNLRLGANITPGNFLNSGIRSFAHFKNLDLNQSQLIKVRNLLV